MADASPPVDCGHGGEACATFVCAHLRAEPARLITSIRHAD